MDTNKWDVLEGQQSVGLEDSSTENRGGAKIGAQKVHTIKEVAGILGITPQGVYKKIKQLNQVDNRLKTELKSVESHGKTIKGLTSKGVEILKETLGQPSFETDDKQLIDLLNSTIEMLQTQLKVKDEQIERLTKMNENNQELLHREQSLNRKHIEALPSSHPNTWEKLKGIFKNNGAKIDQ